MYNSTWLSHLNFNLHFKEKSAYVINYWKKYNIKNITETLNVWYFSYSIKMRKLSNSIYKNLDSHIIFYFNGLKWTIKINLVVHFYLF